uniref:C-methyltransferase n=1 Tax=Rhododendron dauricum TaxID=880079 RepID=UPI003D18FC8F
MDQEKELPTSNKIDVENGDGSNRAEEEELCSYSNAIELAFSVVLPMVMKAAVELQVLDIIAKAGPRAQLSPSQIASQLPAAALRCSPDAPKMLDRMLCLLASHSILTCSAVDFHSDDHNDSPSTAAAALEDKRLYGLTPLAKYFVPNQDGVSLGPLMCLVQDKVCMKSWYELKGAVLEGGVPFMRVYGVESFDYPGTDPRFNEVLNNAMVNYSTIFLKKLMQSSYNGFEQVETLVDVGGGLGVALELITSKYPHIKAINFDLPHVIKHAKPYPGLEHVGGDMFESVPKGDAIFMKGVLHDWSDDLCLKLLKNCYKALPDNGKIIAVERILPEMPNSAGKGIFLMDLQMMTHHLGGRERTQQEYFDLAISAGFSGIRLECLVCNLWVIELYK